MVCRWGLGTGPAGRGGSWRWGDGRPADVTGGVAATDRVGPGSVGGAVPVDDATLSALGRGAASGGRSVGTVGGAAVDVTGSGKGVGDGGRGFAPPAGAPPDSAPPLSVEYPEADVAYVAPPRVNRLRSLLFTAERFLPVAVGLLGAVALPTLSELLLPLVPHVGSDISVLISVLFSPTVGILFATLLSITVSVLRQRQQDIRSLLFEELATIRTLAVILHDSHLLTQLGDYLRLLSEETFEHRFFDGDSDFHDAGQGPSCSMREAAYEATEVRGYTLMHDANRRRLREPVEGLISALVTLRTRRRATLDTGFPRVHYVILAALGASTLFCFLLEVAAQPQWLDVPAVRLLFALLLALLTSATTFVADIKDPFQGHYRLSTARVDRTRVTILERVGLVTSEPPGGSF